MPVDEKKIFEDLKKCMKKKGDQGKVTACAAAFKAAGGTAGEGGKVFSISDGSAVFVTTNGGKVFEGGKVFP